MLGIALASWAIAASTTVLLYMGVFRLTAVPPDSHS